MVSVERELAFHISESNRSSSLTWQGAVLSELPRAACSGRPEGHTARRVVSILRGRPVIKALNKSK